MNDSFTAAAGPAGLSSGQSNSSKYYNSVTPGGSDKVDAASAKYIGHNGNAAFSLSSMTDQSNHLGVSVCGKLIELVYITGSAPVGFNSDQDISMSLKFPRLLPLDRLLCSHCPRRPACLITNFCSLFSTARTLSSFFYFPFAVDD